MSLATSTTTSFTLLRDEAKLLRAGLMWIVIAHHEWKTKGRNGITLATIYSYPTRADRGEYIPEYHNTILHVTAVATNSFTAGSRRLRLDPFELAACILGVRVGEMACRHGHFKPCPPNYKVRARRLVKKLERLRKRAKRAYTRIHGQAAFAEASHRWQQHVRFVRAALVFCVCNRQSAVHRGMRAFRRALEDEWMDFFREELPALELAIPPEPELRDLVKRAIRSGRRLLRCCRRMYFHNRPGLMQERIRLFVANSLLKSEFSAV